MDDYTVGPSLGLEADKHVHSLGEGWLKGVPSLSSASENSMFHLLLIVWMESGP